VESLPQRRSCPDLNIGSQVPYSKLGSFHDRKETLMKHVLVAATLIVALATFASAEEFRPIFHPPTISILEALQQDPTNFSTLIGLLTKADIKELRDAKASYTLFAPTSAAFAKLSPEDFAKLTTDPKKLRQL